MQEKEKVLIDPETGDMFSCQQAIYVQKQWIEIAPGRQRLFLDFYRSPHTSNILVQPSQQVKLNIGVYKTLGSWMDKNAVKTAKEQLWSFTEKLRDENDKLRDS